MEQGVSLSQCMIVKNEEKNIEQALSWGKEIMQEQIVVDTGSSDQTVEIAKRMGAKVFHFQWKEDFSAAKNFAIDQAAGNWIAFLDADEYLLQKDAKKLKELLEAIETRKEELIEVISCPWLQLDDDGNIFSSSMQSRIFKKSDELRYCRRIHEYLSHKQRGNQLHAYVTDQISIYHTGYSEISYKETKKLERNICMINRELKKNPQDYEYWCYLGDSLSVSNQEEEAKAAYRKVASNLEKKFRMEFKLNAISSLIRMNVNSISPEAEKEVRKLYRWFQKKEVLQPDIDYWTGVYMAYSRHTEEAVTFLEKALEALKIYKGNALLYLPDHIEKCYQILMELYIKLDKLPLAVKYGVLSLRVRQYQDLVLASLIKIFHDSGENANEVLKLIEKLYHMDELKDKLFALKAARSAGFKELGQMVESQLSPQEQEWLGISVDGGKDKWN